MRKTQNETVVGFFVIVGFVFLSLVVFFVSGVYMFRPGYSLNVMYDYVSILDKGAPIRMAGVRIGEVNEVQLMFDESTQRTKVKVKLFIEKGVEIRDNYKFEIRGTHVLSEPHIEISPEPGKSPILQEGQTVIGEDPVPVEDLIKKAHHITDNVDAMVKSLSDAVTDPQGAAAIKEMVINLSKITKSLETILSGNEKELGNTIANLNESSASLTKVLGQVENGEGTVGQLLMKDELYQEMKAFVAEIKAHPWRLMKRDKKFLFF